jgi:hypothetical protein
MEELRIWFLAHYDVLKDFSAPVIALIGLGISAVLAIAGLKTFSRWQREKIEERRIETAIDALALAYESKIVFQAIRSAFSNEAEYKDMPAREDERPDKRSSRGAYWVVGKRITDNRDYFERVWKLQPTVMAIFGEHMEEVFGKLHDARATIQAASQTMTWDEPPMNTDDNRKLWAQLRTDLWGISKETDRVQESLDAFRKGIEKVCKPVVDREFSDGYIGDP